jgi:YrbI family 3-deoxy-D-manno-octulosonate 8-phosphate phosphatase
VHFIGASSLAGAHRTLVPEVLERLARAGRSDIRVVAGGVIPDPDIPALLQAGVTAVFGPGTVIPEAASQLLEALLQDQDLFSGSDNKRHIWAERSDTLEPLNYDYRARRREQDMQRQFNENGSIYVLKPEILRRDENRLGGRIGVYPMGPWREYQLDTKEDAELIDWILRRPEFATVPHWPDPVELVVFDFDGVFTDNAVLTGTDGSEFVRSSRGDGWGIARLRERGVSMLVLSTEKNPVTAARCRKMGLECIHGVADKAARLDDLLAERGVDPAHTVYVGNDMNDEGCLRMVGFPVIVGDAHPDVAGLAALTLTNPGGNGAVREFCDLMLRHMERAG